MKRRSKLLIFSIVLLGLIYYVSFLAPYNLEGMMNPRGLGILNQSSFTEMDELGNYFKGYKIDKVTYLGSDTYHVYTDKGEFIIIADYSDSTFWKYKIFKFDKKVQYFTNPM